jgi:hypothetical protein
MQPRYKAPICRPCSTQSKLQAKQRGAYGFFFLCKGCGQTWSLEGIPTKNGRVEPGKVLRDEELAIAIANHVPAKTNKYWMYA